MKMTDGGWKARATEPGASGLRNPQSSSGILTSRGFPRPHDWRKIFSIENHLSSRRDPEVRGRPGRRLGWARVVVTERIKALLEACEAGQPTFPPTVLFNENWLLRIVIDWF